jgi:hypothetical protein
VTRLIFVALFLFAAAVPTSAQTNWLLKWTQPNATPAEAGLYVYTIRVDAAAPITVPVTCSVVSAATQCQTPLPTITTPGQHTVSITAANAFGASAPATLTGAPPATPINITVTVTVTIP